MVRCQYPLGAGARADKLFTVFPAALQHLDFGSGVLVDQVLLQMLHHPVDQRAAVPLSTEDTVRMKAGDASRHAAADSKTNTGRCFLRPKLELQFHLS